MIKGQDYTGLSVIFFCHDGNGNFLLAKRTDKCRDEHNRWDVGGGGVRFGEKIKDALVREVKEEYCADIIKSEFLGFRDVHREHQGKKTHWVVMDFKVFVDKNNVKIGEAHKISEIKWAKLDCFPKALHSQVPFAVKKYRKQLEERFLKK